MYTEAVKPDVQSRLWPVTRKHGAVFLWSGMLIIGSGLTLMIPFSHFTYTAVGIDSDRGTPDEIIHSFYHISWPGDGSFRVGTGKTHYSYDEEDIDVIDLAGRFFAPPRTESPNSIWNRLGFWRIHHEVFGADVRTESEYWIGIPSWLPAVIMLGLATLFRSRCNGTQSHNHAASNTRVHPTDM